MALAPDAIGHIGDGVAAASLSIQSSHCHDFKSGGASTTGPTSALARVRSVTPLGGFQVRLIFTDGTRREIDLEPLMRGTIFADIRRDPMLFKQVTVDHEMGTIVWPNGADIDPDVLHGDFDPE